MPSQGSITKTIRINAEDRAVIEQIMEEEGVTWSGAIHHLVAEGVPLKKEKKVEGCTPEEEKRGVPQLMNENTQRDIEKMCELSEISTGLFFDEVCRLFNEGKIEVEKHGLRSRGEYDLGYLEDVCHRLNVDPQEMINKLANSLVRR